MISRIHADDNTIGGFEILEGELERGLNFMLAAAHPACRQYLEAQARLVDLPDHFGHGHRIRGKERIADLDRDDWWHFFKFLRRPGKVVKAGHEKIDLPALVGNLFDAVGIMC
ncbi:MAG TPA: hypothetical protein VMY06_03385 [Sedimentisphaerales bacterium]|nr:hypothetical protein [Sedimentisphaerales bacterium]